MVSAGASGTCHTLSCWGVAYQGYLAGSGKLNLSSPTSIINSTQQQKIRLICGWHGKYNTLSHNDMRCCRTRHCVGKMNKWLVSFMLSRTINISFGHINEFLLALISVMLISSPSPNYGLGFPSLTLLTKR